MAQWTRHVCCQAWQPESDPWDLCDRENPPKLTSDLHTHTMVHVYTPPTLYIQIKHKSGRQGLLRVLCGLGTLEIS